MVEKYSDDPYGLYTNEFPNYKDGKDLAFVSFYEKSGWLNQDGEFPENYDAVHGKGSFKLFLSEWEKLTHGKQTEIWSFREDLSGISGDIKASSSSN